MGRQEIANILMNWPGRWVSILISSHILAELEALCKNILILTGRVLASAARRKSAATQELVGGIVHPMRLLPKTGTPHCSMRASHRVPA